MLYLHLGFELTVRHQYTSRPDLLPTISEQETLQIESTLRTPHNRHRASIFPDEFLMVQAEMREAQTLLLGPRETPLQARFLIRSSRDTHLHGPLGRRKGASERCRTPGQCRSLDVNDLGFYSRLGGSGELRHSEFGLHALAMQSTIAPLA